MGAGMVQPREARKMITPKPSSYLMAKYMGVLVISVDLIIIFTLMPLLIPLLIGHFIVGPAHYKQVD
ncbi:hypothetical protein D3C72_1432700 [compost metagenome]